MDEIDYTTYREPDFSALSLPDLLEKANDFVNQAYSQSLSSYGFLSRALDRTHSGSHEGAKIVEAMDKVKQVSSTLLEAQQDLKTLYESLQQEK